jgi:hypothetical protein
MPELVASCCTLLVLAPLALMHYVGLPMQQLLLSHPNGIPLQYAKKLLPFRSRFNVHLYLHVHLHASYSSKKSVLLTLVLSEVRVFATIFLSLLELS